MVKYAITIAYILFVSIVTACRPEILAKNSFIQSFVDHDLLSLEAVVMTITFASVANIHFAISKIIGRAYHGDVDKGQRQASGIRRELNGDAWLLFGAFIASTCFLVVKGMSGNNQIILSAMNGLGLGSLLVNVLVFHDIYSTLFTLSASDLAVKGEAVPPETTGP